MHVLRKAFTGYDSVDESDAMLAYRAVIIIWLGGAGVIFMWMGQSGLPFWAAF